MSYKHKIFAASLSATLLLISGCTPIDVNLGAAAKHNYAAQIIEPEPVYSDAIETDGTKSAAAVQRYQTDKVKQPRRVETTSGGGSGSGSGSGSGNN